MGINYGQRGGTGQIPPVVALSVENGLNAHEVVVGQTTDAFAAWVLAKIKYLMKEIMHS